MNRNKKIKMKGIANEKKVEVMKDAYQKVVQSAAAASMNNLEKAFQKIWQEDDATINNGELWHEGNNDEDDIYNL